MSRRRTSPTEDPKSRSSTGGGSGSTGIEAAVQRVFAPHLATPRGARFALVWRRTLRLLRPLGAVSQGNGVRVLNDGDEVFETMWAEISAASRSVILNTYILEPDRVGERTLSELEHAAARGCRVLVVLDAFGSHRVSAARLAALRTAGATVLLYNPIARWPFARLRTPLSRLVRNHRKILVVDGRVAFCGGMNIAEEYAGIRHGSGLFRDTQLRLEGPCARDLAAVVEGLAREMARARFSAHLSAWHARGEAPARELQSGALVLILESSQRRAIQKAMRTTLARALERCYLTSPYFVPPPRLTRSLVHAARRGVDVRVLTAGRSDVPLVRLASQHLYGRLLRKGVRIYEMHARVLHSKTVTVDGVYASVGSFNLDHWSDRRNLEVSVSVLDRKAARELEEQFQLDLTGSTEVELATWEQRSWPRRVLGWLAYRALSL